MTTRRARSTERADAGFTVTELILVVAILGIVGATVAPRFFQLDVFRERFFFEEVRSAMAHSQRLAVATGCPVQVTLTASSFDVRQRTGCTTGAYTLAVANPATGQPPFTKVAPPGVTLTSSEATVRFDALGRATNGGGATTDVTITIGARLINTAGETGHTYTP